MPNWCSNNIIVTGKPSRIKEFDNKFKKKYTNIEIDIVHMKRKMYEQQKEKYKDIKHNVICDSINHEDLSKSSLTIISFLGTKERKGYSLSNFVPQDKERILSMGLNKWRSENWGTRWDLNYDSLYASIDDTDLKDSDEELTINYGFSTAWSPCCQAVQAMAEQFKDLNFVHEYNEGGSNSAGIETYIDGELSESLHSDDEEGNTYREFCYEHGLEEFDLKCGECGLPCYDFEEECEKCHSTNLIAND